MPIKFRCKHCQQFLGISKSRAGAVVDCPQCGRSVRVPELDGRTRKLPPAPASNGDDSLMSALSELSSLENATVKPQTNERPSAKMSVVRQEDFYELEPVVSRPAPSVSEWQHAEVAHELNYSDEPIALSDSLAELAMIDDIDDSGVVSEELLQDMKLVRQQSGWFSGSAITLSVMALLLGLVAGWWGEKSGLIPLDVPFGDAASSQDGAPQSGTAAAVEGSSASAGTQQVLQGTIQYADGSGRLLPDAGAIILLLPRERQGTLLFDARSLHQPVGHADRNATLAALNSLDVKVATANGEGLYAIAHDAVLNCRMVVVSKHSQRPTDVPLPAEIELLLRIWFQSPNHVCGQLAAQMVEVEDSNPLDFQFQRQQ